MYMRVGVYSNCLRFLFNCSRIGESDTRYRIGIEEGDEIQL